MKEYISYFVTYELVAGRYSIKAFPEGVYTKSDHDGTIQFEDGEIGMKTKLFLTPFGIAFGRLSFDEKSFLNTLIGFKAYLDYNNYY